MNFYACTHIIVITFTQIKIKKPFQLPTKFFMSLTSHHLPPSKVTTIVIFHCKTSYKQNYAVCALLPGFFHS